MRYFILCTPLFLLGLLATFRIDECQASRHSDHWITPHRRRHHDIVGRFSGAACPIQPRANPSPLIASSIIYDKYAHTSSTYRTNSFPSLTTSGGAWSWYGNDYWTSGFYPAILYLLNERKNLCPGSTSVDWLSRARQWSTGIEPLTSSNSQGHDVGFLAYPFVEELKINPNNETAKSGIQKFGTMLANRFSSKVGCTRSWDSSSPDFLVIMDNMMNLELFFEAGDLFGLGNYYNDAKSHANTTSINHLRPDGSSYHVVDYNQNTGAVIRKYTAQGYADWSTWSRGQAWGTYGFAAMYTRTGISTYLDIARKMGQTFLRRLAEDASGIPKWDFDAPEPTSKDTSAAAIASSAFLQLYEAEENKGNLTGAAYWRDNAITLLSTTADRFFQTDSSWEAILSNGTSNHPSGSYNTGLIYGDYYFIKAGNQMLKYGLLACPQ